MKKIYEFYIPKVRRDLVLCSFDFKAMGRLEQVLEEPMGSLICTTPPKGSNMPLIFWSKAR